MATQLASSFPQKTTFPAGSEVLGFDGDNADAVVNFTQAALVEAVSGAYAEQDTTPTIEELTASETLPDTVSSTQSIPVWIAPFACEIVQASMMVWNNDVAADDTDYWIIRLTRTRANNVVNIVSKYTSISLGEAITRRTDWNFDALTFSATNKVFQKGDCLGLTFAKQGAAVDLQYVICTVRYQPT